MRHLCGIVIVLQMAVLSHCLVQENVTIIEEPKLMYECFYEPAKSCPETGCIFLNSNNDTALCCNIKTPFTFKENIAALQRRGHVTRLHIRNITTDELNMTIFQLPSLESIAVTDSNVERVVTHNITNLTNLQCLSLSNNNINYVDSRLIENLPRLEQLDLSFNNLSNLSIVPPANSKVLNFSLDISNNTRLWCNNITDLIAYMRNASINLDFLNRNSTMCMILRGNYWFKFVDPVPFHQLEKFDQIEKYCLANTPCTCMPHRAIYIGDKYMYTGISVNCIGKNLTYLPEVPEHTIVLNISNNKITNLKKIKTDQNYNDLLELHAQNNQISSLQDIEGSKFIKQFQVLDIRDNKLNEIQTYIFNNAFENSRVLYINVKLAGNKIKCDCNTAQQIKLWLLKHEKIIDDYEDILCENSNVNIISLDPNTVCKYPRVWTDYINYIIAGEVAMFFLLISKVSYDYWVFRTAGYLPWPASKMPKMPCDWVFEA